MSKGGFGKFVAGVGIGAALGVLFAPKSGAKTRKELKKSFDNLMAELENVDAKDVYEAVEAKIAEIREGLETLDAETVLAEAKKQSKKLQKAVKELVDYVQKQSQPVIDEAVENIRKEVLKISKNVVAELEKKGK